MRELARVRCLRHVYPDRTEVCLCGLDFVVQEKDRLVVLGPNGSGKTTLLAHLMGLLEPVEGEVEVFGTNPCKDFDLVRRRLGVVFQNVDEQIIGPTVWDDVAFSLLNNGIPVDEACLMVEEILEDLGISHLRNKIPHYLSGGEKRKVALAGAMVMKPELLILDEPFTGLDPKSKGEILEALLKLNEKYGTALVVTTHEIDLVPVLANKVYVLDRGNLVLCGTPGEVLTNLEVLQKACLEPPILVELFRRLADRGLAVGTPITMEEAEEQLLLLVGYSGQG
ncbi:MAG: energy-coupling factor ABC transporter ATP-binding protein [Clostridia bacterium]|nr:energy-coupling factor ABC transporter ATP-binding protein [Clostridia bacterium]